MKKGKKLSAFLLAVLFILTFAGCVENEDFVVYGRFKDNFTSDRFEVFCDWETITPLLNKHKFESYNLYASQFFTFTESEKTLNSVSLFNYSLNDEYTDDTTPGSTDVTYGAICCNSVNNQNHSGEKFFTEPMIQIQLYNPNAKRRENEIEPDYILGYRAVYSLDGELALEEGQWFLDEDKDKFCRHYFECMLKIIGKSK